MRRIKLLVAGPVVAVAALGVLFHRDVARLMFGDTPTVRAAEPDAPEAVKALAEALKDRDVDVRKNAALSLGRIGKDAKSAVPALIANFRGSAALPLLELLAELFTKLPPEVRTAWWNVGPCT